jgi:hypothetical protein
VVSARKTAHCNCETDERDRCPNSIGFFEDYQMDVVAIERGVVVQKKEDPGVVKEDGCNQWR